MRGRDRGGRATAVTTADGERIPADAVVLNPDLPVAYRDLLAPAAAGRRLQLLAVLRGAARRLDRGSTRKIAHHNIHFGRPWRGTFDEVIDQGELMSDPSLLVTNPSRTDPSLAPDGRHTYYVLAPTPNLSAGIDWRGAAPRYGDELLDVAGGARLRRLRRRDRGRATVTTPADWARARHGRRARRSRPRTRSPRPARSGRATCPGVERGLHRLRHPARRRRADGADLRPAGRRADPRPELSRARTYQTCGSATCAERVHAANRRSLGRCGPHRGSARHEPRRPRSPAAP